MVLRYYYKYSTNMYTICMFMFGFCCCCFVISAWGEAKPCTKDFGAKAEDVGQDRKVQSVVGIAAATGFPPLAIAQIIINRVIRSSCVNF